MRMTVLTAAALLVLAGCSGGKHDEGALNETGENANVTVVEENIAAPAVQENVTNTAERAAPPPAFSDEQQTRDDADASGLTARIPDEETQPGQSGNETRPVEK